MPWAIATLLSSRELLGVAAMVRAGLREFYLPRVSAPRPSVLFPGYAFIRPPAEWRPILMSAHVTGVLGINAKSTGRVFLVEDELIDEIKNREKNGFVVLPKKLAPGVKVRVRFGHMFFGGEGLCVGMRGRERVEVLLRYLGDNRRVVMKKSDLELMELV